MRTRGASQQAKVRTYGCVLTSTLIMPQPVKPWTGVLDASAFGPACMQTDDVPKSEDCLTLNVWRPAAASDAPLPVMVWIGQCHQSARL